MSHFLAFDPPFFALRRIPEGYMFSQTPLWVVQNIIRISHFIPILLFLPILIIILSLSLSIGHRCRCTFCSPLPRPPTQQSSSLQPERRVFCSSGSLGPTMSRGGLGSRIISSLVNRARPLTTWARPIPPLGGGTPSPSNQAHPTPATPFSPYCLQSPVLTSLHPVVPP